MRVKTGSILVQLDREPYQVTARDQAGRGHGGRSRPDCRHRPRCAASWPRSAPVGFSSSMPSKTSTARSPTCEPTSPRSIAGRRASSSPAPTCKRGEELVPSGGISKEDLDTRRQTVEGRRGGRRPGPPGRLCDRGSASGLPPSRPNGKDLGDVPPDLVDNFSAVRQALGQLLAERGRARLYAPRRGTPRPRTPSTEFLKQDPSGNLDQIYAKMIPECTGHQTGRSQAGRGQARPRRRPS